jgi:hypothetical protein
MPPARSSSHSPESPDSPNEAWVLCTIIVSERDAIGGCPLRLSNTMAKLPRQQTSGTMIAIQLASMGIAAGRKV